MTLIITGLADDAVVQAFDRRLTVENNGVVTVYAENAIKATTVECGDAFFVMSYTGFAVLGPAQRTDLWLINTVHSLGVGPLPLTVLLERLRLRLAMESARIGKQSLTVVCAGFFQGQPFIATVSNTEGEWGKPLPELDPDFKVSYLIRFMPFPNMEMCIHGDGDALEKRIRAIQRRLRRRYHAEPPERRAKLFVRLIRLAADAPGSKRINKDCHSVIVRATGQIEQNYHGETGSGVSYFAHSVGPKGVLYDMAAVGTVVMKGQPLPKDDDESKKAMFENSESRITFPVHLIEEASHE